MKRSASRVDCMFEQYRLITDNESEQLNYEILVET